MGTSEWVSTSMPYLTPREKGQPDAWGAETAARGRRGSQRIVHAGEIAAPPEIAELLGIAEGENVVVRRRVMYVDDAPCELTDTYYPVHIAQGTRLAGTAKIPGGAISLLMRPRARRRTGPGGRRRPDAQPRGTRSAADR